MANVPQAHPEPQIVPLRDLPPVRTTANGKRKSPPPSEAEKTMLAELAELRADGEGPAAPETTTAPRQRHIPIKRPAPDTWVRGPMSMRVYTDGDPGTKHYSDADMRALLESATRRRLSAEAELRAAVQQFDGLIASCQRHHQGDLAKAALQSLQDRRPA
jgi:hypothetical protein